jgi:hypothetical protein
MRSFCRNCGSSLFVYPSKEVAGNDFIIVAAPAIEGYLEWSEY